MSGPGRQEPLDGVRRLPGPTAGVRKPSWLKVRSPAPGRYRATGALLADLCLHTVCDEARCPNKGECYSEGTATFLILGDRCTRDCRFCGVGSVGANGAGESLPPVDGGEARRVAEAAVRLGLRHVVVTSVTRDDLPDGGAAHFAATVAALRAAVPAATVEVLIPDFLGDGHALGAVLEAGPDVLGHNLETVPRLYPLVRAEAHYGRSLRLLERAADWARGLRRHLCVAGGPEPAARRRADLAGGRTRRPLVKTGLMLGLGETLAEAERVLDDCAATGVDVVTVGQYLQPGGDRLPVARYVPPSEFDALAEFGRGLGLEVVAAPFVRSSYRAGELVTGRAPSAAARLRAPLT